jgi:hypothetical protein
MNRTIHVLRLAALCLLLSSPSIARSDEEPTPLRPATLTWGGVSNNDQFATEVAQTGWEFTARHMDAMFLHGAYWMNQSGPEWEANCTGLGKVLVRHGKKAHVETGFGEGPGFDPAVPEKRQPYKTAMANAARIKELKSRFGIEIEKVRADWFPIFAMAAYAKHYQIRDDNLKFLAMVTGAGDTFGPYPPGFTAEIGHWRDYVTTLNRELPGMAIAFDQAPCNHRPLDTPEVRAKVPWPGLGYGYTRTVAMLNQPPVLVDGKPVEVKFDFADQFMGAVLASRAAGVNFVGFEGDTPFNYLTNGPADFPREKLIAYLLAIEKMVHAQGLKNCRVINDCGQAYGDADDSWLRVDLGSPQEIDRIRFTWGGDPAADGTVRTSLDDKEYVGWGRTQHADKARASADLKQPSPRSVRYIRWDGRERATPRGYQIAAIEVYSPAEPGTDLARGRHVATSSLNRRSLDAGGKPLHAAALVTDGDPATFWESNFIDNDAWDKQFHDRTLEYLEYYQGAGGRADEYIAESWYSGPFTLFPETQPGTFTNLARDLIRRLKGIADDGSLMPIDLSWRRMGGEWSGDQAAHVAAAAGETVTYELRIRNDARETNKGDARVTPLLRARAPAVNDWKIVARAADGSDVTDRLFARGGDDGWFVGGLEPGETRLLTVEVTAAKETDPLDLTLDLYWNPQDTALRVRDSVRFTTPAGAASLDTGFRNPPASARPYTWWHWMDGNVTKEGITADLEDMARVGLGGFHLFDGGLDTPDTGLKPVAYRSPEWIELIRHTMTESKRLGLEFGIHGAAGWSLAGGTWVKPAQSMRKLVWSETAVRGPQAFAADLPKPPGIAGRFQDVPCDLPKGRDDAWRPDDYRDSAVVAFRLPEGATTLTASPPQVTASDPKLDGQILIDGSFAASATLGPAAGTQPPQTWVQFTFAEPFMARSLLVHGGKADAELFCGDSEETLAKITTIKLTTPLSSRSTPTTAVFNAARGRIYRLVFPKLAAPVKLAEITLHGEPLVNGWDGKAGFRLVTDFKGSPPVAVDPAAAIRSGDVIDLTGSLAGDRLTWNAPAGDWVILRIGHSPTGKVNGPAPAGAAGLECDKMDRDAVRAYYTGFLEPFENQLGPLFRDKDLKKAILADSWEADVQNWTPRFIEAFAEKRGYSPVRFLPVLTGRVVDSAEASERFLWDFRRTCGDLIAECFYGEAQKICDEKGLTFYSEAPGVGLTLADAMQCKSHVAVPMGEFWVPSAQQGPEAYRAHPLANDDSKEAASAAHLTGRSIVAAEAFTAGTHSPWQQTPASMKAEGDFYFALGINRFFFHTYAHQPWLDRAPGMTMNKFGTHLGRTTTWWADGASPYFTYLARCQHLLQRGLPVADFAVFLGESVPGAVRLGKDPAFTVPAGFDYDACGAETLLHDFTVTDGRLTLPSGVSYAAVVLRGNERMTPAVARRLAELVAAGATVIGPPPQAAPGLSKGSADDAAVQSVARDLWGDGSGPIDRRIGKGRIVWNGSVAAACDTLGLLPDAELRGQADSVAARIHRRDAGVELYFVSNQKPRSETITATFRVAGKQPEWWDPVTGDTAGRPAFRVTDDGRTELSLTLAARESGFVVFRTPLAPGTASADKQPASLHEPRTLTTLTAAWQVSFDQRGGGPAQPQAFPQLIDWTTSSVEAIRHFSGTATYRTTFDCPDATRATWLDLGTVHDVAAVTLNDEPVGTAWTAPWRVNVAGRVKERGNVLEIRVSNSWPNRIIGDQSLPEDQRVARMVFAPAMNAFYKKGTPLLPSGLLGPVTILGSSSGAH